MAILTLAHDLHRPAMTEPVLMETQTCLLIGAKPFGKWPVEAATAAHEAATRQFVPDETLLFQYSALGFNSHRNHLDRGFARDTEGFPDRVVNGGLATLLLTEFLRVEKNVTPGSITARHVAPLFCGRPISFKAEQAADTWLVRAFDDAGRLAVELDVVEAGCPV